MKSTFGILILSIYAKVLFAQCVCGNNLLNNPNFDASPAGTGWTISNSSTTGGFKITTSSFTTYRSSPGYLWFALSNGTSGDNLSGTCYQNRNLPSCGGNYSLRFYYRITTSETTTSIAYDILNVRVKTSTGTIITSLTLSNLNASSSYLQSSTLNIPSSYAGSTIRIEFAASTDVSNPTTFRIDDVSLIPVTGLPNLTVISPSVSSSTTSVNFSLTVYCAENNSGSGVAGPNVISLHISPNSVLTPGANGDQYLGEIPVNNSLCPLSQTILLNTTVTIPCNLIPGTYYLFYSADGGDDVSESSESDNFATRTITVNATCGTSAPTMTYPSSTSSSNPTQISTTTPTIQWSTVSGAHHYGLYIKDIQTNQLVYDNTCVSTSGSFTIPSGILVSGRNYQTNMQSFANNNSCCNSCSSPNNQNPYSSTYYFNIITCSVLSSPGGLHQTSSTPNSITLSWNSVANASSYQIENCSSGSSYNVASGSTSTTIGSLSASTNYQYRIRAIGTGVYCNSAWTACVACSTQSNCTTLSIPSNFNQASATETSVRVSWNSVANASSYLIEDCNTGDSYTASSGSTSRTISNLAPGESYEFQIQAVGTGSFCNSDWSSCITCLTRPYTSFTSNFNNIGPNQTVRFTNLSSGADSYSWSFPGGSPSSSTATNPNITYSRPGTYSVTLVATNDFGSTTAVGNGYITVHPTPTVPAQMTTSQVISSGYPSGYAADPVNLATGTYSFNRTLLKMKVVGGELGFSAFYNSGATNYSSAGMGAGWSHSFDYRITNQADTIWKVHYPDLHETDFIVLYDGNGKSFSLHHGVFDDLFRNGDGTWRLTMKNQVVMNFNSSGLLQSIVDRNNNTATLSYNSGRLTTVTGPGGRTFNLNYSGGLLSSVTDHAGRQVNFGYTGNDLTGMSDAKNKFTTFTYNASHEMEDVKNPLGNYLLRNHYTNNKVDSQLDGNSKVTAFEYDTPVPRATTVTYPDLSTAVFYHDTLFRLILEVDELGFSKHMTYDYNHQIVQYKNENLYEISATFDSLGNQLRVQTPEGVSIEREFNATNDLVEFRDGEKNLTVFTRNSSGQITHVSKPGGNSESYTYFPNGLPQTYTNGRNIITGFIYNSYGDLIQINAPKGTWHFLYDAVGRNIAIINPLGDTTSTVFDENDNVLIERDEEGFTIQHFYDDNQNEIKTIDKNGYTTDKVYDNKDRLHIIRNAIGGERKIDYNVRDVETKFTDELNNYVEYTVNDRGDVTDVRNELGFTTHFQLDDAGNIVYEENPIGVEVDYILDSLYRKTATNISGIIGYSKSYDRNSNVTQYVDGRGNPKSVEFDSLSRPIKITDEENGITDITYDGNSNVTAISDPNSHVLQTIYDVEDKDSLTIDAAGLTERRIYNAVGDLITLIKPHVTVNYTYYKNHRPKDITCSTGESFHYEYDGNGNLTIATGPNGTETSGYDSLNRQTSHTDFWGNTTTWEYDATGNQTRIVYPGNMELVYAYNEMGLPTSVTATGISKTWTFEYDEAGNHLRTNYPNGFKAEVTRDEAGRVSKFSNFNSVTQEVVYQDSVWRDGNDNIDSNAITGWIADSLISGVWNYAYKDNNVLLSDGQSTYEANNHGALTKQVSGADSVTFTWSANDILTGIIGGNTNIAFHYDASFRLAGQTKDGQLTRYVNDVSRLLHRVIMEQDSSGNPTAYYIYGNGLVGRLDTTGNLLNYHFDLFGNTAFLTDDTGAVTDKYLYADPFGTVHRHIGNTQQPFTFLGQYGILGISDSIYNIRARFYQSTTRRFLSKDPFRYDVLNPQAMHRFIYALNNPLIIKDINGLYGSRDNSRFMNWFQLGLDVAGLIPLIGEPADLLNAYIYYKRGDNLNAGLSLGGAVPLLGWGATAGKFVNKGVKVAKLSTRFLSTAGEVIDLAPTLKRIDSGIKFPHRNDGAVFKNREGLLPKKPDGYYTEYVHPTPGVQGPGAMRVIIGKNGEVWFTQDHYKTFISVE